MGTKSIVSHRLYNQAIATDFNDPPLAPAQVAARLGTVQAQEERHAQWAIGLRCRGMTGGDIHQALAEGNLIRTWLLRGTLHYAAADDVHWLLALVGPRLVAGSARRYHQLELDETAFTRSFEAMTASLTGGRTLTRTDLLAVVEQAGISTAGQRGYHILRRAGLEGLICFGAATGKENTFGLLEEWAPGGCMLAREEAQGELAVRFFSSHGPATLQDFIWWSGLPARWARLGLNIAQRSGLVSEKIGEESYWRPVNTPPAQLASPTAWLLPAFDEYYLGYKSRQWVIDPTFDKQVVSGNGVFRPMLVIDGQVVGVWQQVAKQAGITVTLRPFRALSAVETEAVALAACEYGLFLGLPVTIK
jgi:hypothetical protein